MIKFEKYHIKPVVNIEAVQFYNNEIEIVNFLKAKNCFVRANKRCGVPVIYFRIFDGSKNMLQEGDYLVHFLRSGRIGSFNEKYMLDNYQLFTKK